MRVLFNLSKTRSLSEIIQELKGSSSKWIKAHPSCPGDFFWQAGYGAFSVGQSSVNEVRTYIQNQKDHHTARSFQDELRTLLRRYEVAFEVAEALDAPLDVFVVRKLGMPGHPEFARTVDGETCRRVARNGSLIPVPPRE